MKIARSEFGHEYQNYRFGYCEYAMFEPQDNVADFYGKGFLPYSADPSVKNLFYMARSARILLQKFEYTSENRRIGKRFDEMFLFKILSVEEAKKDHRIRDLFMNYFSNRHGKNVMPGERFDSILDSSLPLRVLIYEKEEKLVAAILEICGETFCHFWFSAYDLPLVRQSLGMWLMLDAARRAAERGCIYYYIGTVYGEKALYKTNLEPLEFWDGTLWNKDLTQLKKIARAESKN